MQTIICACLTERISAYLDHWLQPLPKSLPSYIKDTKEFIKCIESTKSPKDCILCTQDVSSLYTNIPTEDGIYAALQAAIENWENKDPLCPPTSWLKKLLEPFLYKNVFRFNNKFYKNRSMAYTSALISPQNFQQLKSHSWTCAHTKGRDLPRKAFWISKPISSPLTPNNIYMLHPPTLPEEAGVSSRENYSDTFERTQTKLHSRCTKRSMSTTRKEDTDEIIEALEGSNSLIDKKS